MSCNRLHMFEVETEETTPVRAFLVYQPGTNTLELRGLIHALDMETAGMMILPDRLPEGNTSRYGTGTGKAQEIAETAVAQEADCIIFDYEISPTRQRNWEKLTGIPVFDRQEVILRIFARRAQTKEAVLQVELARLTYSLPRLAHSYGDMARQRGGSYGSKGAGETKLELDRRTIQTRIDRIKQDLAKVVRERKTQRKRREKIPLPSCALVGYTNAGKSSLLNALTGSNVYAENQLFATLDPTTRRLALTGGSGLLLTDTVGFISNLPHNLVDAFKSTLEEAVRADVLLIVVDASDPEATGQYKTVCNVLEEIGADTNPRITVLNKIDSLKDPDIQTATLGQMFPGACQVSAVTRQGLDNLTRQLCDILAGPEQRYRLPVTHSDLLTQLRKTGTVADEIWQDDTVEFTGRTGRSSPLAALLEPFRISF